MSKKPFMSHVFTPMTPPRWTRIRPVSVFSPMTWKTSAEVEDDQVDRDDEEHLRKHLDQKQEDHPDAPALEAEAAERVGAKRAEQHGEERSRGGHDQRVRGTTQG